MLSDGALFPRDDGQRRIDRCAWAVARNYRPRGRRARRGARAVRPAQSAVQVCGHDDLVRVLDAAAAAKGLRAAACNIRGADAHLGRERDRPWLRDACIDRAGCSTHMGCRVWSQRFGCDEYAERTATKRKAHHTRTRVIAHSFYSSFIPFVRSSHRLALGPRQPPAAYRRRSIKCGLHCWRAAWADISRRVVEVWWR